MFNLVLFVRRLELIGTWIVVGATKEDGDLGRKYPSLMVFHPLF